MTNIFETHLTADGSETFYSPQFDENFHSKYGAKKEAEITYIKGCRLIDKIPAQLQIKIIDVCYGLGYNTAAAIDHLLRLNPQCQLELVALELDESVPQQALAQGLLDHWSVEVRNILTQLLAQKEVRQANFNLKLLIGDARKTIQPLVEQQFLADAIFLDPFSPPKCPQLWTVEFLSLLARCLKPDGIIATYSCSAVVRTALQQAGLTIGANFTVGKRSPGTIASYQFKPLPPLSKIEIEHLQTRASVPFRDPQLEDNADTIKQRREQEQKLSPLESTSQWKKRWFT